MSPAERALHLLDAEDSFAAVESLAACPDPAEAAAAYDELVRQGREFAKHLETALRVFGGKGIAGPP